jgi:hypothetical protein
LEGFLSAILREEISVIEILDRSSNPSDFDKKVNRVDIFWRAIAFQKNILEKNADNSLI